MILQFFPEDNMLSIKANLKALEKKFADPSNDWIAETFDGSIEIATVNNQQSYVRCSPEIIPFLCL